MVGKIYDDLLLKLLWAIYPPIFCSLVSKVKVWFKVEVAKKKKKVEVATHIKDRFWIVCVCHFF